MTVPVSALQSINPSSIIELFELELNVAQHGVSTTYRFHAGVNFVNAGEVVWNSNSYSRMPIEAEGFEYSGNGQLPRPKVRVSNIMGTITALLLTLPNGLEGAKVTRIRTLARYLDGANFPGGVNPYGTPDPTAELPRESYYLDRKVAETRDVIEFELSAAFDLQGVRAPKRQTIQNICQWRYRSYNAATSSFDYTHVDCPYTGTNYFKEDDTSTLSPAEDVCSKRLSSCELRFGVVAVTGAVTNGSNTLGSLSTTELDRIDIGDVISGFGLPPGTTVTAKSSSSITLSANATGTSVVSGSGTMAATGLTITMGSVTGIKPGMVVTGTYVPSDTYVSSVNSSTKVVTLSISDNTLLQGSAVTYTGTYVAATKRITLANTTGIQVSDIVVGSIANQIYKKTTVSAISANAYVTLNKVQAIDDGTSLTATFYRPITPTSQTYTFTASPNYVIRPAEGIPFGSFPGVGGYR